MKVIPKDTKPKNYIWKKYTIFDAIIAAIVLLVDALIISTKMKHKFILALVILVLAVCLFFPTNERLLYQEIFQFFKYLFFKKKFKDKEIDKIIPFTGISDDNFIIYPNYFAKVIEIGSKDFALEDDIMQDLDIEFFKKALNSFERDDTVDIVKIEKAIILDEYIEMLKEKIDSEDNEMKKAILLSKLSDIALLNSEEETIYSPAYYLVVYGNKKEDINNLINSFLTYFSKTKIETKILSKKEIAIFLKYNFLKTFNEREVDLLENDKELLNWIKPKYIEFNLNHIKIDDIYSQITTISDYPIEVGASWASNLFSIENTRSVIHIRGIDQQKGIRRVDKAINEILSREEQISKASDRLNNDIHIDTMKELLVALQAENERFFDVSFTIQSFNYDKKDTLAFRKSALNKIKGSDFRINTLWSRQQDGFLNSNISRLSTLKIYERGINSLSLSASFPFVFSQIKDEKGMYLGLNEIGYPVLLDIFKRSGEYKNSNAIVIGTSGSGKSHFLKTLITHLYSENSRVFILDPENEYRFLCDNLNGENIDIGSGNKGMINPFHIYPVISDTEDQFDIFMSNKATFNSHLKTLESFFKVILPGISDEALEVLNNSIIEVYAKKGICEDTEINCLKSEDFPIFDDLLTHLKDKLSKEKNNIYQLNLLSSCVTYISKFAKGGRYSDIWNGKTTLNSNNDFTLFNFQSLFASKNETVANAQMLLIFRFLEQELINQKNINDKKRINQKTVIIVDEAHLFIDKKYPIALDFFYQMSKRIRKYGGSFIPATQSISDWNANDELKQKTSAILKNSQYSFVFNLKGQDIEDLTDIYRLSSPINQEEQKTIALLETGNCFLIANENLRTVFYVDCNDSIKTIFSKKLDQDELNEIKEIVENQEKLKETMEEIIEPIEEYGEINEED